MPGMVNCCCSCMQLAFAFYAEALARSRIRREWLCKEESSKLGLYMDSQVLKLDVERVLRAA